MLCRPRLAWLLVVTLAGSAVLAAQAAAPPASQEDSVEEKEVPPPPAKEDKEGVANPLAEFKFDPKTPAADLLPPDPKGKQQVYVGGDLARVPEVLFEAPPRGGRTTEAWTKHVARNLAAVDHLNRRAKDGFIKALLRERRDLAGLPFLLGDDCRMDKDRSTAFSQVAARIRGELQGATPPAKGDPRSDSQEGDEETLEDDLREHRIPAEMAARRQILGPAALRPRLAHVKYLTGVPRPESSRELVRLAVFDTDRKVREAAVESLTVRRERDYTAELVKALRYPWPAVAGNAAEAIVKLERKDLLGELVALLEEPDPRLPREVKAEGEKKVVARELVRINHNRSCLLCHAAADPEKVQDGTFVAEVPLPSEPLPDLSEGYGSRESNLLVRIDMTYLRQDFSVMQTVKDAAPWPKRQRFDYLVRTRELTRAEAKDVRERLKTNAEEGELSPYQQAAVKALREMTGRDLPAKAEVWRKYLKLKEKNDL